MAEIACEERCLAEPQTQLSEYSSRIAVLYNVGLDINRIGFVFSEGMASIRREKEQYNLWRQVALEDTLTVRWADGPLRKRLAVRLTARALHIARTGMDGKSAKPFERGKPSEKTMEPTIRVPGLGGRAMTAFDVSQILSRLAKERVDL